jgi:hypothetical protein
MDDPCKLCEQVEKKDRRVQKMILDIERWQREGNRKATIDKTRRDIREIQHAIDSICKQHEERLRNLNTN